jgi:chemotaxis protein CheD
MQNTTIAQSGAAFRVAQYAGSYERPSVYLHPGQIFAAADPHKVTTILGSCVAVCLWDPVRGTGGVNHFLLPEWAGNGSSSARFGNVAVNTLIRGLIDLGSSKRNMLAKVFGGASVLEALRSSGSHLGSANVTIAVDMLESEGIPVIKSDVGGRHGRKLIFQTDDGAAWVKRL